MPMKVAWLDSAQQPSLIHLTVNGKDTLCGEHEYYLKNRQWHRAPKRISGHSNFCRVCFEHEKKSTLWFDADK